MSPDQLELFKLRPRPKSKPFRSASGWEISYWPLPSNKYRVELSDGALIDITKQSPGRSGHPRLYTKIPGSGQDIVQARNLKTILAQITLLDQIGVLNKSIQIKLKQQDDVASALSDLAKDDHVALEEENARPLAEVESLRAAEAKWLEMEAENTRLGDENARVREQLAAAQAQAASSAAGSPQDPQPRIRNQSINYPALQWAVAQRSLSAPARHILLIFAIHADERGYTWPGVDRIAAISGQDPGTVRRRIEEILAKRRIFRTKKRSGTTGQVKVYRLPRITYERGGKSHPFQNDESAGKARDKRGISLGNSAPNNGIMNNEQPSTSNQGAAKALGNSIPNTSGNASDSVCLEGYQNQNQPARDHPKWPEFARYCRGQRDKRGNPGQPTEKGFRTWLNKQNPKWRNTPAPNPDGELGWELNGKFYTQEQATQLGIQDPDLQVKFRRTRRRDGQIVIISEPKR